LDILSDQLKASNISLNNSFANTQYLPKHDNSLKKAKNIQPSIVQDNDTQFNITSQTTVNQNNLSSNTFFSTGKSSIEFKGETSSYKYVIPFSNIYEPFLISIYSLHENQFIKSIYLDKNKLFKNLMIEISVNSELYKDPVIKT
jgi:hypothetical protein